MYMTTDQIRDAYLKFFEEHGHTIVRSSSLVPYNDPTLLFTNAGMNQFKDIYLGKEKRDYVRATTAQKCVRAGGKQNDLDNVGYTARHHTFFEMLGNFSFGDYFKKEAITFAWTLLTEVYKLPKESLMVTVYDKDDEAYNIWKDIVGIPENKIVRIGDNKGGLYESDNFWQMGDTGPCGPCSEIFYDHGEDVQGGPPGSPDEDGDRFIEIWNIVFMQYNRKIDGTFEKLAKPMIDNGLGLERIAAVLQGVHSNYEIDLFVELEKTVASILGVSDLNDKSLRVIADHIRSCSFLIADGVLPSNEGRGYVLRRIIRRAVRHGRLLGAKEVFFYKIVSKLVELMGKAYPELVAQKELIDKVMMEEEESFLRTLETGIKLLDRVMAETKAAGSSEIDGVQAFTLFDTYGFPLDLTELICRENGLTVDEAGFNAEMQKQKERARGAAKVEADDWQTLLDGKTVESEFVGWDFTEYTCHILRYRKVVQKKQTYYQIVLDKTPFYAEMGGQVGDQGVLVSEYETIDIIDTKSENGLTVHIAKRLPEHPEAEFMACVDTDKRRASEANHSATHLLDQALREVLGTHVEQKGSLVSPEGLRFDFSHFQKVTAEELRQVERIVNARIRENIPLQDHRDVPIEQAKELGAIALFGEKYGDRVRVVQFGQSVEFCGGCHVKATGQIGMFKIVGEGSVAAGIRRIEAVTGAKVEESLYKLQDMMEALRQMFNGVPDLRGAIERLVSENSGLKKQAEEFIHEKAQAFKQLLLETAVERDGICILSDRTILPADAVKDIAFQLRTEVENALVCIGSVNDGKPLLTCAASDALVKEHDVNVGKVIREAAKLMQGGGGGQPHFATAGGKNPEGLSAAIDKFVELALS